MPLVPLDELYAMGSDWFRKQSWSPADQEDFHRRLARAREGNRPQYAFIQGYTLMQLGEQYYTSALALFDLVIDRYPASLQVVQALTEKATCLERRGDTEGALTYYDRAVERMRTLPSNRTWAWVDFAWLVATERISDRYEQALALLDEFGREPQPFPSVVFRLYASRALIHAACGKADPAADAARTALASADRTTSGLPYHPMLGVVGSSHADIRARLEEIASAAASSSSTG